MSIKWIHQISVDATLKGDTSGDSYARMGQRLHPSAVFKLWGLDDLRALMQGSFGRDIAVAFDTLPTLTSRVNLARFCVLHEFGGLCFDTSIRFINAWVLPATCGVAAFNMSTGSSPSWISMHPGLLLSQVGRPEWAMAIKHVIDCYRETDRPSDVLGQDSVGRAFAAVKVARGHQADTDDQWVGEIRPISTNSLQRVAAFVAPDKLLVAITRTAGSLGAYVIP
jgi:hypothetical protein